MKNVFRHLVTLYGNYSHVKRHSIYRDQEELAILVEVVGEQLKVKTKIRFPNIMNFNKSHLD